jgi:hypothetical protein
MKSLVKYILGLFLINAVSAALDPQDVCNVIAPISVELPDQRNDRTKLTIQCMTNFCTAEMVTLSSVRDNQIAVTCPVIFGGSAVFIGEKSETIRDDLGVYDIKRLYLNFPGSTKHLECHVSSEYDLRFAADREESLNKTGMHKTPFNIIRIMKGSSNLLEFIQQVNQDQEYKANLKNWGADLSLRSSESNRFIIPEGSIPLNQNPLLTILSRPEFKTQEFKNFIDQLLAKQMEMPLICKNGRQLFKEKLPSDVKYNIATFIFGDAKIDDPKTFDGPEYASFAKLMAQHITLITFDQQASSSSS